MKFVRKTVAFCILTIFCSLLLGGSACAASDLGVGLRVVPKSDAQSQISGNTKLWFVVKQENETSRELVLTGSSSLDQQVTLDLVQLERIDGEPAISQKKSEISPWVKFSDNNFVLKKNQTKSIFITIAPSLSVKSGSYEAYLIVNAASTDSLKQGKDVTQAIIKNSARIAQPVFVGVGNYEDFKIDFELKDIDGIKNSDGKFLRVTIDNHGKTPISPSGQVQLKNLDFEQEAIGPFAFYSSTIAPRTKAFIDVAIPDSVTPGKWKLFVSASQGNVTVTKEFTKDLTFKNNLDLLGLTIRVILLLVGLAIGLWAYRTLRGTSSDNSDGKKIEATEIADETKALIAELEAKTAALEAEIAKKTIRKKVAKKAATKKPVTSVATSKKAAAKKVVKKTSVKKPEN